MGMMLGVVLQVGQPQAVAVPPIVSNQPIIEAQVIRQSTQPVSKIGGMRQNTTHSFYKEPLPEQTHTYSSQGAKRSAALSGRNLDIFA